MIKKILSLLGLQREETAEAEAEPRRKHVRYPGIQAEVIVGDKAYSIHDWSPHGAYFETSPDARLIAGENVHLTLKFRLFNGTISIQQPARILRAVRRGVAVEFMTPLMPEARRQFERVLDGFQATNFLESQAVA